MKNKEKINELLAQYHKKCAELTYKLACDLLDMVSDKDVLRLYSEYKEIFAEISSKDKSEILNNRELLDSAIAILIEFLSQEPMTRKEFDKFSFEEKLQYIAKLMEDTDFDLFDFVKYLENN